ncbi:prepilin-type N-terminal cleavage/methylation domain-containing protein [Neomoorella thermoacetica]|uniref:prepilin-type N-terminal cleavage/methylation domain-containing protein n=1 Tax=Neomoorella thermoacetica TaxID=1525 RepID=UPI0008FA4034|nr:prepilin-type N-terminal cleavage/methylation domain-containing protein [Moorella thermoacetica]OIQ10976.1 type II secretion system protein G precursor [Moorella thermoacetica]
MWQRLKKARDQRGFTLVELLVVIAIIGILAAIIAPNAFKAIENSKVAAAEADYKAIKAAVLNFYTDTGKWPDSNANGQDPGLVTKPNTSSNSNLTSTDLNNWNGPYLERWPSKNPWGGKYYYLNDANQNWDSQSDGDLARYLQLDSVPDGAFNRLKADLGDSMVIQDTTNKKVYILISKD